LCCRDFFVTNIGKLQTFGRKLRDCRHQLQKLRADVFKEGMLSKASADDGAAMVPVRGSSHAADWLKSTQESYANG